MTLALSSDQLAGSAVSSFAARLRQNLRFDGLWWRKLAALGCAYGPEWVKRYLPAPCDGGGGAPLRRHRARLADPVVQFAPFWSGGAAE